jgi:hypothetical protein
MGRAPRKLRYSSKGQRLPGPRHVGFLRTHFWAKEAPDVLGSSLSSRCIVQIELAIGRYVNEMEQIHNRLDAANVEKACHILMKSIDDFKSAYESSLADPEIGQHIRFKIESTKRLNTDSFGLDEEWWNRLDQTKHLLLLQIADCRDPQHSSSANPCDDWIRRMASALRDEGLRPTAFSYESRLDRREPTSFVRFVVQMQAELPEWLGQHEPDRAGHRWITTSKAIQRALRGKNS